MNVSLPAEMERWVEECIKSGRYGNASEVVRAGLRLLQEHETGYEAWVAQTRELIRIGLDQANRGDLVPGDEARKRLAGRLTITKKKPPAK